MTRSATALQTLEIAHKAKPSQIYSVATKAGIKADELEVYGSYKAKISLLALERRSTRPNAKLICVTAMTSTKEGEGKTTVSIGLTQALGVLKKNAMLCLRQPSLAPIFGYKGGATGGGYSQVLPMEDINLHFTGDFHAVQSAHNLLAAVLENHIHHGNALKIDRNAIFWRRTLDVSDRQLRDVIVGTSKGSGFVKHKTGFDITAASEVMAILSLSTSIHSLKAKLSKIIVALTKDGKPVTAKDLKAAGAMAMLLKDAIKPNLVQTLEGQPVLMHTGPFANVSHGNSSLVSLQTALKLSNYVITESGFSAELGLEKMFDVVCREGEIRPNLVVMVVSAKALKAHSTDAGLQQKRGMDMFRWDMFKDGFANLQRHIRNIKKFGVEVVVAVNRFPQDTDDEIKTIRDYLQTHDVDHAVVDVVRLGGRGGIELGEKALKLLNEKQAQFKPFYDLDLPTEDKIHKIATELYGASGVVYSASAKADLELVKQLKLESLPVVIAKTPYSFTDDPEIKGAPSDWKLHVRGVQICSGAGFLVVLAGKMMLMPGLPEHPVLEEMDLSDDGRVRGLF